MNSLKLNLSNSRLQRVELLDLLNHSAIKTIFDEAPLFAELVRQCHEQGLINLPDAYVQSYKDVLYQTRRQTSRL